MPLASLRALARLRSILGRKLSPAPSDHRRARSRSFRSVIEILEPRVLLHSSPVLDAEHLAVFGARNPDTGAIFGGLAPDSSATYISVVGTGPENWSDPSTWRYVGPGTPPSSIPGPGANVIISLGSTVIVDKQFSASLHTVRDDGTLRFDLHANTSLLVDTVLVEPEGTFQMGTDPSQPDPLSPTGMGQRIDADKSAKIVFSDTGPIDLNWDPLQFSRGLDYPPMFVPG
jgi:G8 domain